MSWWFVHKLGKMQRKTFPQFKVKELADFPLPLHYEKHREPIAELVKEILQTKKYHTKTDTSGLEKQIDQLLR